MTSEQALPSVYFDLTSVDGNAYSLMGNWAAAARRAKWPKTDIDRVLEQAKSGDYDNLIVTLMRNSSGPSSEGDGEDE
jgi:hypothetical protein